MGRLYDSLQRQTNKDFEWLIIDDGSTDNTKELVSPWLQNTTFTVRYIYQENQGMHGAHNTAYKNIRTVINTCVDSDDYMPDNAVELILKKWSEIDQQKYAGLVGLDVDINGKLIGTKFTLPYTTLEDFYLSGGKGDKKLVYRTDVINAYPEYPLFEGERYVSLGYKYLLIDKDYELATLNEPLLIVEYQADGSSLNMFKQYIRHPKGFAFIRKVSMQLSKSPKRRFIEAIHYVSSSILLRNRKFIQESPRKLLTIAAIPFGILLYCYIKIKTRK